MAAAKHVTPVDPRTFKRIRAKAAKKKRGNSKAFETIKKKVEKKAARTVVHLDELSSTQLLLVHKIQDVLFWADKCNLGDIISCVQVHGADGPGGATEDYAIIEILKVLKEHCQPSSIELHLDDLPF